MKEYFEGFQSATIICVNLGIDFAKAVANKFTGDEDYSRGYKMGIKMFEEREATK